MLHPMPSAERVLAVDEHEEQLHVQRVQPVFVMEPSEAHVMLVVGPISVPVVGPPAHTAASSQCPLYSTPLMVSLS